MIQLKRTTKRDREQAEMQASKRGDVKGMTQDSKRRLFRTAILVNEQEAGMPSFLTLTYAREYSNEWKDWKRDLDTFLKALKRKWPGVWGLWKLEFQKRGAPHYHMLLWDGPMPEPGKDKNQELFAWVCSTWNRIVGETTYPRLERIRTWNGVIFYTTKYLAKATGAEPLQQTGRVWGKIGWANAKLHTVFETERITEQQYFAMRRVLRKMAEKKLGKKVPLWSQKGLTVYKSGIDGLRLLAWAATEYGEEKNDKARTLADRDDMPGIGKGTSGKTKVGNRGTGKTDQDGDCPF